MKTIGTLLFELSLILKIVWSDVVVSKGLISMAITIPYIAYVEKISWLLKACLRF